VLKAFALLRDFNGYSRVVNDQDLSVAHDARNLLRCNVGLFVHQQGNIVGLVQAARHVGQTAIGINKYSFHVAKSKENTITTS
jgi:hypothetical protein